MNQPQGPALTTGSRPNVVFVLTDDQGYGDLGCTGNPVISTPNIDRFYEDSVRFTDFHVGPTCAPTRAGLMTGHYANSTGVWHTIGGRSLLRENEWTLATALREQGYRTGIFGKWHLGDAYPYRPQDRGFDVTVVHGGGGVSQTPDWWGNDYFDDTYLVNGEPKKFTGYCTDVWFQEALKFIEANKERSFFCYIATNAPHSPYNVEPRYAAMYEGRVPTHRARFYGMISNIDENFGLLRRKLQEWGLEENTILLFMTDNGSSAGASLDRQGFVKEGYNAGLRGMKGSPYDGGHRVPFFIRWEKGGLLGGRDIPELTANVDFMPTILDLCGVPNEGHTFHGTSLAPLLRGENPGESKSIDWNNRVLVTDSQRVTNPIKWRLSSVMTSRWRLVNGRELYDAKRDREQRYDIAGDHQEVVSRLRQSYEEWWNLVSTQFSKEIPIVLRRNEETKLTAHDWRNEDCACPWNQGLIRQGMAANGYWEIRVDDPGEYEIELRRWPRELDTPITSAPPDDDVSWYREGVPADSWRLYEGGTALAVNKARLHIGDQEQEQPIAPHDTKATFRMNLPAGQMHLQTWLIGQGLSIGAYYVYIKKE